MTNHDLLTALAELHDHVVARLGLARRVAVRKEQLAKEVPGSELRRRELGHTLDQVQTCERWLQALLELRRRTEEAALTTSLSEAA